MGRYITDYKANTNTSNGILPATYTTMIAGEAILQGDLLSLHDDGKVYWVTDPEDEYAALRPLSAPTGSTDVLMGTVDLPWGQYKNSKDTSQGLVRGAALADGNVVLCGTSTSVGLQFRVVTITGRYISDKVTVATVLSATANYEVCALTGGGFAIAYANSSGYISRAVYTNAGVVTAAGAAIENFAPQGGMTITGLADGGFVVTYFKLVAGLRQPHFAKFNAAGVLQGSITQIHALTGDGLSQNRWNCSMDCAALNSGSFVIGFSGFSASGGNQTAYVARYNSSGVIQGSITSVVAGLAGDGLVAVCQTSDNGYAVAVRSKSTSGNCYTAKYNSSGVLQGSVLPTGVNKNHSGDDGSLMVCSTGDGGYFSVFAGDSDTTYGKIHFHRGYSGGNGHVVDLGSNSGTAPVHATWNPYHQTYFWHHAKRDSNTSIPDEVHIRRETAKDIDDVTTFTIEQPIRKHYGYANNKRFNHSALIPCPGAISSPYAVYANVHQMNTGNTGEIYDHVKISAYRLSTATFVGVATTAASPGNPVTIQLTGVATTRLTLIHSISRDFNGTTPPGQKFQLVGNTCILQGIQPITSEHSTGGNT